jgi:hypothetical protein
MSACRNRIHIGVTASITEIFLIAGFRAGCFLVFEQFIFMAKCRKGNGVILYATAWAHGFGFAIVIAGRLADHIFDIHGIATAWTGSVSISHVNSVDMAIKDTQYDDTEQENDYF